MWDVHAHVIPPDVLDAAQEGLYGMALDGNWLRVGDQRVLAGGAMADVDALRQYAVKHQLSLVLSPPPILVRDDISDRSEWFTFVNRAMAQLVRQLAVPAKGLAVLPLANAALALGIWETLDRVFCGVTMGASCQGRTLDRAELAPFWEGMARSGGGLVFIHGGETHDERLSPYYLTNLVGYPYEDMVAAATLVFSGLPVRHPEIQWAVSHGGGGAAFLLGRWQRGYDTKRPGILASNPSPVEVFGRLWFDSVVHDRRTLAFLMDLAPDHVVFGTDYPFPMGTQHQIDAGTLAADVLDQLHANGERLMNLVTKGRTTR